LQPNLLIAFRKTSCLLGSNAQLLDTGFGVYWRHQRRDETTRRNLLAGMPKG
jgi:hypothetical protein